MAAKSSVSAPDPYAQNALARGAIIGRALEMDQIISTQSLVGTIPGQVVNVPFRNVGLIRSFLVMVEMTLAQTAAETLNLTPLGPSAFLSNVTLNDLSNVTRISTPGWHLHALATARRQAAFGAAYTNDSPVSVGSAYQVIRAPSAITAAQTLRMYFEVPCAYSDNDLRGAIYSNVVNATGQLQLTINPNLVVGSAGNPSTAAYQSTTAAVAVPTNVKVTVWQRYFDQLPMMNGVPILPGMDLSTMYEIKNTAQGGLTVNQDNTISYGNMRQFLSTVLLYDNAGTLNAGTDINYFTMRSANLTDIFKRDPFTQSLTTRLEIGNDMPRGMYYFNHRRRPVETLQYGNMQLVVNPSVVTNAVSSQLLVGFEAMSMLNMVTQAGSLLNG